MFKELISYYLKYHKDKCFFSAQMFETLKNNIEKDLIESYELSSNLIQNNMNLFHSSGSYFDFLINLFNIKDLKIEKMHNTKNNFESETKLRQDFEAKFQKKIETFKKDYDSKFKEIHEKQKTEIQHLSKKLEERNCQENTKYKTLSEELNEQNINIHRDKEDHTMQIEHLTEKLDKQNLKIIREKEAHTKEIKNLTEKLDICKNNLKTCHQEKEAHTMEIKNLTEKLNTCQNNLKKCQEEMLKYKNYNYNEKLDSCENDLKSCREEVLKYENFNRNVTTATIDRLNAEVLELRSTCEQLKETNGNLLEKIRTSDEYANTLNEQLEMCQESKKQLEIDWTNIKEYTPSVEEINYTNLQYKLKTAEEELAEINNNYKKLNEEKLNFQREWSISQNFISEMTKKHEMEMDQLRETFQRDHKFLIQKTVDLEKEWELKLQELQNIEEQIENNEDCKMEYETNTNESLNLQLTNCIDVIKKLQSRLFDCVQRKKELKLKFKEIYDVMVSNISEAQHVIHLLNGELESKTEKFNNLQKRYDHDIEYMRGMYKQVIDADKLEQESRNAENRNDESENIFPDEPFRNNNFREQLIHLKSKYKLLKRDKVRLQKHYKNLLDEKEIELKICIENLKTRQSKEELRLNEENIALQNKIYSLSNLNQQFDADYERFKADQQANLKTFKLTLAQKEEEIENLKEKFQNYITMQKKNLSDIDSKLKAKTTETHKLKKELSNKKLIIKKNLTERSKQQDPKINMASKVTKKYLRKSQTQLRMKNKQKIQNIRRNILSDNETPYIETKSTNNEYEHKQIVDLCKYLYLKYFYLYQNCIKKKSINDPSLAELETLLKTLRETNGGELIQILFNYVITEVEILSGKTLKESHHVDEMLNYLIKCFEKTEKYIEQ